MFPIITRWFINSIIRTGRLTEARTRYRSGTSTPRGLHLDQRSCLSLVLDEVLDTDFDPDHYDALFAELMRRGFSDTEIDEMRRFAWETAGWMNYDMMLWEWTYMDEEDIRLALKIKFKLRWGGRRRYKEGLVRVDEYLARDPKLP